MPTNHEINKFIHRHILHNLQANRLLQNKRVQKAVQLLPAFVPVLGLIAGNELTLSKLIDEFVYQYDKKDTNILTSDI